MSNMLSEGWNSVNSYQRAEQEFQMKKQLQQAQAQHALAQAGAPGGGNTPADIQIFEKAQAYKDLNMQAY